jgi:hypothetical protein
MLKPIDRRAAVRYSHRRPNDMKEGCEMFTELSVAFARPSRIR